MVAAWRTGHPGVLEGGAGCQLVAGSTVAGLTAGRGGYWWTMAKKELDAKQRKKLGKKEFALPKERKYPIPDKAHARNALARVAQNGTPSEQKKVEAAVKKRFPSIGKKPKK